MTSQEFQADKTLAEAWQKELEANTLLKTKIEIATTEAPINSPPNDTDSTSALIAYGVVMGYQKCLKAFTDTEPRRARTAPLKSTYGAKQE